MKGFGHLCACACACVCCQIKDGTKDMHHQNLKMVGQVKSIDSNSNDKTTK